MRATFALAGCLVVFSLGLPVFGAIKSWNELSSQQIAALDASQQRLGEFDRALQILDHRRARGQVRNLDYRLQQNELVGFIANEADFQNAILHKNKMDPFTLSSDQADKLKDGCECALLILARGGLAFLNGRGP